MTINTKNMVASSDSTDTLQKFRIELESVKKSGSFGVQNSAACSDVAGLQSPVGFLKLLWPDTAQDGWMTFFAKGSDGKPVTAAFHLSKMAEAHKWAMTRARTANVWHGVGLRKAKPAKNKRGDAENVIAIPGLWLDLDVRGPGHAEKNLPATFEDALDFLASLPLKPTLIVFTGGGLQPYYLFPEPMRLSTEADWTRAKTLSERWQRKIIALGRDRGWKLDNTSDLSRVLRLPGTYNRKTDEPVLVTVPAEYVNLAARYDLDAIEAAFPPVEIPQTEHVHADGHGGGRDDMADADRIGKLCPWFAHCRTDAAVLPEPEWYAWLGILVHCKGSRKLAHDWSKVHPKYNSAETDAKLAQAKGKAGPRTCDSIRADFGGYCSGCTTRVKSPIVLGWREQLPKGFISKPDGVYYCVEDKDGKPNWVWICSSIKVLALTRDSDGREWGRLVEIADPDGNAHQWAMPMALLAGSGEEYRRELLSRGLRLAPGKISKERLHSLLSLYRPQGRARCVPRIGWHGRRYVLPDDVFGSQLGESVILQSERAENPFKTMGELVDWQESIGHYCLGNSRLVLAVSMALAAPLLHLAGGESGGLHLVGGSSLGKTTALEVAGSVCGGGGVRGYILQWRTTANGLESVAAAHCDALLCLDELSQVAAKEAAETAYMLGNGTGKNRANKMGGARKPAEWRLLFLSTGELTLADKIREDGRGRVTAGQAVRVVDIEADAGAGLGLFENLHGFPDGDAFARHLKEAAGRHYGTPFRAFLEKLTAHYDEASRVVPGLVKDFIREHCPTEADGQVRRVCARFALVATGGELGAQYGVLPWPEGEATQAVTRCFQDWLSLRGGTGAAEVQAGIAQVRAFFQVHGASRFENYGEAPDTTKITNRAGWRKNDSEDSWEYYVLPSVFREEIARGHDAKRLVKELVARGFIMPGKDGRPASLHKIPGQPQSARYYRFAAEVVLDDHDDITPHPKSSRNMVTRVSAVTKLESRNFFEKPTNAPEGYQGYQQGNPPEPEPGSPNPVTPVTQASDARVPNKSNDTNMVTQTTQATPKIDADRQQTPPVIDLTPAASTSLWTGPAEVEI